MKKKFLRPLCVVAAMTMMSANVYATGIAVQGGSSEVTATTTVDNPTINVTVPTLIGFTVNPLQNGYAAAKTDTLVYNYQMYSGDLVLNNESDVPVVVDVAVTPTVASGVKLLAKDAINTKDTTVKTKDMHLLINPATKAALVNTGLGTWETAATGDNAKVGISTGYDSIVTKSGGKASFALSDKSVVTTKSAGFRLLGYANPSAAWATTDVTLKVAFLVTAIPGSWYGAGKVVVPETTVTGGVVSSIPRITATTSNITTTADGVYSIANAADLTVSSLKVLDIEGVGDVDLTVTTDYTFAVATGTGTLTILKAGLAGEFVKALANSNFLMQVTLSDGSVLVAPISFAVPTV